MTLKRCLAFSTVALAFAAPAAYAQNWIYFDSADTNHDGVVSRSEWDQAARQHSQNGTPTFAPPASARSSRSAASGLGPDELVVVTITPLQAQMMNEQRRESLFRSLDANGDGAISAAEAAANPELVSSFARLDRNGDGRLDRQEFARVQVNDTNQAQANNANAAQGASSAGGGGLVQRPPLPSRSIEERSKFSTPAGTR